MNKYTKEELELMNYDDIAFLILKDKKKKMKLQDLFNEICTLLELNNKVVEDKIVDFFELLSTDKRFIMLENGYWDLIDNHSHKISLNDEDEIIDEEVEDEENSLEDDEESTDEDDYDDEDTEEDMESEDLKELVIIDEEDMESEI